MGKRRSIHAHPATQQQQRQQRQQQQQQQQQQEEEEEEEEKFTQLPSPPNPDFYLFLVPPRATTDLPRPNKHRRP